jgi:hypothetical protein
MKRRVRAETRSTIAQIRKTTIAIVSFLSLILVASLMFSSSAREFCLEHPGILIVALAVIGEVWCDWKSEKTLRERLKKFFGIALSAGLLWEIAEAVKADKKLVVLKDRAAILESTNLVLRLKLVELELNAKARHISPQQHMDLVSCIKKWNGDKGPLLVQYHSTFGGVDEAHGYCSEILSVVQEAGCFGSSATNRDIRRFAIPYAGVSIIVQDASNPPPFAITLKMCFANNGVLATEIRDGLLDLKNFETNIVILWISQKPLLP